MENIILYPNTEKELFFDSDYKQLPNLSGLTLEQITLLYKNLVNAYDSAYNHYAGMLETALFDDILSIVKHYILCFMGKHTKGKKTVLAVLNSDTLVNLVLDNEVNITDPDSVKSFVAECLNGNIKPE